jgi:hypothetical protein
VGLAVVVARQGAAKNDVALIGRRFCCPGRKSIRTGKGRVIFRIELVLRADIAASQPISAGWLSEVSCQLIAVFVHVLAGYT